MNGLAESLDKRCAELEAENARLRGAITGALSLVRDRERIYADADTMGEMMSIRLTGLQLLAEAIEPGIKKRAMDNFLAEMQASALRSFDAAI